MVIPNFITCRSCLNAAMWAFSICLLCRPLPKMRVEGGPAQREGTHKNSYLEAERRSSSAGWRRDGAEQKRARAFIDFQKDVTKFFHYARLPTFQLISSNFVKTREFSSSAAEFITRPFVIHAARPHISHKIDLAKISSSISFSFAILITTTVYLSTLRFEKYASPL